MSLNLILSYFPSLSMNFLLASIFYINNPPRTINQILAYLKTPVGVSLSYFLSGCKHIKLNPINQTFYTLFLTSFSSSLIPNPLTLSLRERKSKKLISNNQTSFNLFLFSFSSPSFLFFTATLSLWECKYRKLI